MLSLEIHINDLAILVNCSPQIMLLAVDFDEDLFDIEGITVATMLSLQAAGAELYTPEPDGLTADGNTALAY